MINSRVAALRSGRSLRLCSGQAWTMALESVTKEMLRATPFSGVGFVTAVAGGRVRLELQNSIFTYSSVLGATEISEALRPPIAGPVTLAPLAGERRLDRAFDQMLAIWEFGALFAVPIAEDAGFWAATPATAPQGSEIETLAAWSDRIAAAALAEESEDAREERFTRIDALSDSLPSLGRALDVREVFGHLSAIARRVLPHESAVVGIRMAGDRQIRLHALSAPPEWKIPEIVDNPYEGALTEGWDFAIHHDLAAHPLERNGIAARLGLRASLRVPIRLEGRNHGVLGFAAFQPDRYRVADVAVARRIADYVALALSHQRLADQARETEEVRVRAANLEMLDGLLKTLTGVLDVREVFDRVSKISERVIRHDAMSISMPTDDGQRWIIHVTTGALGHLKTPFEMPVPTPRLLKEHWEYELVGDMASLRKYDGTPSVEAGMRSLLSLPVWVEGRLRATVNFFSAAKDHFTTDDVLVGRRITDHIALALSHQRLAEEARRTVELRARAANLELLDELLATLGESSEIDEVFDRLSAIARRVLPHDTVVLPLALPDGIHAKVRARGGADAAKFPDIVRIPESVLERKDWEYDLIDDLQTHPEHCHLDAAKRGYRSALRVPIDMDGRYAGALVFFSFAPSVYRHADVPVARRIADRIALLLARKRRTEAARRADEAEARASKLESRVRALTEELDARTGYRRVVGESASWRQVLVQAAQVAETETTVLLLGESGTGKEVVARFIHRASSRRSAAFVALNCAALPESLLEAELFGYERGAFTGAAQSKPGQLEQAAGGMLFLDEIGEMSLAAQAKFLRVLQEREFQRLGGTRVLRTDARLVAATNRDLPRAIEQGTFREDLFYRLNVFAIRLPPLRERRDDIAALSDAFLTEIGRGLGRPPSGISREARTLLMEHHWPGNVRELRNILERAAILCDGGVILAEHLALAPPAARPEPRPAASETAVAAAVPLPSGGSDLKSAERALIDRALQHARFNKSKAAKALGLTRSQLYVRMRRYGLE